jgi:hypothetical protein
MVRRGAFFAFWMRRLRLRATLSRYWLTRARGRRRRDCAEVSEFVGLNRVEQARLFAQDAARAVITTLAAFAEQTFTKQFADALLPAAAVVGATTMKRLFW